MIKNRIMVTLNRLCVIVAVVAVRSESRIQKRRGIDHWFPFPLLHLISLPGIVIARQHRGVLSLLTSVIVIMLSSFRSDVFPSGCVFDINHCHFQCIKRALSIC